MKPFSLKAPEPTEYELQCSVVECLRKFASPRTLWLSITNQSTEGPARGAMLKKMGRRAGASDLLFIRPGSVLFLELKDRLGQQSDSQRAFQSDAEAAGCAYEICRTLEDSLALLWARGFLARDLTGGGA